MNKEEITKHLKEVHKKQETETAESGYFSESTCQGTDMILDIVWVKPLAITI